MRLTVRHNTLSVAMVPAAPESPCWDSGHHSAPSRSQTPLSGSPSHTEASVLRPVALIVVAVATACAGGPTIEEGFAHHDAGGLSFESPEEWRVTEQTGLQEGVRLSVVVVSGPKNMQLRLYHYHSPTSWTPTSFAQHLIETQPTFVPGVKSRYRVGQDESKRSMLGERHTGMRIPLVLTPGPADLPYHAEVYSLRQGDSHLVTYHQLPGVPDRTLEAGIDHVFDTLEFVSKP